MKKTIGTLAELQALRSFRARHGIKDVIIELPGSLDEIRTLEAKLNRCLKACGCEIGAIFVATGLLALWVFSPLTPNHFNWMSPRNLFGIVGSLSALALIGKIIGLAIANWKIQVAIDKFEYDALRMASQEP